MSGNSGLLRVNPHPNNPRAMKRALARVVDANGAVAAEGEGAVAASAALIAAAVAALPLASLTTAGKVKQAAGVADLALTVSNPPTQAEVQSIADAYDALLASLRAAGTLQP